MTKKTGLELLREPFPEKLINKLPKPTKAQNDCKPEEKINCQVCGGWHHPKVVHLDYVGHAALTDRLLDADPLWSWEPVAFKDGLPAFDATGGLWIRLTVCGRSMLGYGNAAPSQYKEVGAREKEVIGDALRNAAMRMGAALDLWHKGDLHPEETYEELCERLSEHISEIKICVIRNEPNRLATAWSLINKEDKVSLLAGNCFTTKERDFMKSKEFKECMSQNKNQEAIK